MRGCAVQENRNEECFLFLNRNDKRIYHVNQLNICVGIE